MWAEKGVPNNLFQPSFAKERSRKSVFSLNLMGERNQKIAGITQRRAYEEMPQDRGREEHETDMVVFIDGLKRIDKRGHQGRSDAKSLQFLGDVTYKSAYNSSCEGQCLLFKMFIVQRQ